MPTARENHLAGPNSRCIGPTSELVSDLQSPNIGDYKLASQRIVNHKGANSVGVSRYMGMLQLVKMSTFYTQSRLHCIKIQSSMHTELAYMYGT